MVGSPRWRIPALAALAATALLCSPVHQTLASSGTSIHIMSTIGAYAARPGAEVTAGVPGVTIRGLLKYHGGLVMQQSSTSYSIFWQPTGTYMSPTYKTLINRYLGDIGGSALYSNTGQYYDSAGHIVNSSSLGGTWTDTSSYPSNKLSDANIQAEVSRALTANGWTPGIGKEFFVYLAKGENDCLVQNGITYCSFTTFCAYHGYFQSGGVDLTYAAMPYAGTNLAACFGQSKSPNNDPDADAEINISSHEQMEAITDPITTFTSGTGAWYDRRGNEIGDKCAYNFGTISSDGGNITMNGHRYIVQQEWSNAANSNTGGCTLS